MRCYIAQWPVVAIGQHGSAPRSAPTLGAVARQVRECRFGGTASPDGAEAADAEVLASMKCACSQPLRAILACHTELYQTQCKMLEMRQNNGILSLLPRQASDEEVPDAGSFLCL